MLLFPDGRLAVSSVADSGMGGALRSRVGSTWDAFIPEDLSYHPYVVNPFRAMVLIGGGFTTYQTISASGLLGYTLLVASISLRFSRSFFGCTAHGEMSASRSNGSCSLLCRQHCV